MPFKELIVDGDLTPRLVYFSPYEVAAGANRTVPDGSEVVGSEPWSATGCFTGTACVFAPVALVIIVIVLVVWRRRRTG